jgi:hypothetical protein
MRTIALVTRTKEEQVRIGLEVSEVSSHIINNVMNWLGSSSCAEP